VFKRISLVSVAVIVSAFPLAAPAGATFPGRDGRIAFVQNRDVFTMNPDGSGVRRLTSLAPGSAAHVGWSASGRRIVFDLSPPHASAQLWLMDADGSHKRLLLDDPDYDDLDPSFSPDGTKVAFSRCQTGDGGTCAIYRIGSDGTRLTALTGFDPAALDFQSPYSPDGSMIAFGRFAFNGVFATAGGVDLMGADGSNVRLLTPLELGAADPDWSPDGSRLVFTTHCCDPQNAQLWTIRADGTQPAPLTVSSNLHDFQPSWSPQGDAIAFERHASSANLSGIYVIGDDGTGLKMIERGGTAPRWGPAP
jgi:Tol biopolymer transport system component